MEVERVDLLREELLEFHERNFKPSWAKLSREIGINSTTLSRISGGGYVAENIIPSCKRCNSSKHARRFEEWYPEQEYFSEDRMGKILNYIEN